jgi:thiol-disulfide isomerase/thioredoxin
MAKNILNLKVFNKFFNKFFNKNMKCVLSIALVIVVAYYVVNIGLNYAKEGFEGKKEFVLAHMTGCSHCEKLMPEWNAVERDNPTNITMRSVERTEGDGPELIKKHKVEGFPTILLLQGGELLDTYSGERTKEGLKNYLNSHS